MAFASTTGKQCYASQGCERLLVSFWDGPAFIASWVVGRVVLFTFDASEMFGSANILNRVRCERGLRSMSAT